MAIPKIPQEIDDGSRVWRQGIARTVIGGFDGEGLGYIMATALSADDWAVSGALAGDFVLVPADGPDGRMWLSPDILVNAASDPTPGVYFRRSIYMIAGTVIVPPAVNPNDATPKGQHDNALPWHYEYGALNPPDLNTGFTGINGLAAGAYYGLTRYCINQNDEIAWDVMLAAGTWELTVVHLKATDEGIFTVSIDGTDLAPTVDCYNAGGQQVNMIDYWAGITIASTGKKRVKIKSTAKNAASSGYVIALQALQLRRTA